MLSPLTRGAGAHSAWAFQSLIAAVAAAAVPLAIAKPGAAEDKSPPAASVLEDLGADLMKDAAEPQSAAVAAVGSGPVQTMIGPEIDRNAIQPELGRFEQGEDVGAEPGVLPPNWLQPVQRHMQAAHASLAASDATGRASTSQRQALDEIDAMIARLQKECEKCGGQCKKPTTASMKPPKPGKNRGAKPSEAGAAATAQTAPSQRAALGNLVNDLWGQLPQRQRDELLQPLSEEFLPEYAGDIEAYFRAMAEDAEPGPPASAATVAPPNPTTQP